MHCLKCGTEIESPQVFCSRCLEDMKNCPVSRETPVVIPKRAAIEQERRGKRPGKPQKQEELLAMMRKRQRRLLQACVLLTGICLIFAGPADLPTGHPFHDAHHWPELCNQCDAVRQLSCFT